MTPEKLREMGSQLIEMAEALETTVESAFRFTRAHPSESVTMTKPHLAQQAEDEYRLRRIRIPGLEDTLLGEPAWDILLDLFIQQTKGRLVSASSACIASTAPMTTALRYLRLLEDNNLVVSSRASHDERMRMVELSQDGEKLMVDYLTRRAKLERGEAPKGPLSTFAR